MLSFKSKESAPRQTVIAWKKDASSFFNFFRHRVISAAAERIAAQNTPKCQKAPFARAKALDCLQTIL